VEWARRFYRDERTGREFDERISGLGYFAEVPTVLIDVQRTGPSTGMPTRTQQSDILLAAYASHGDTNIRCCSPLRQKNVLR
jgi:2-oxoglutarate ferredoxin oxidoreductase subunit alpha